MGSRRENAEQWQHNVSRFYMGADMEHMGLGTNLSDENHILVRTFLLEKAIYELTTPGFPVRMDC